jgi:glycosyltransferase involved in cell wall biosynthesis
VRILQVTPYFEHAWAYGGIPRAVTPLTRALVERGHQVTVCTTDVRDATSRLHPNERSSSAAELRVFDNLSNRLAYHLQLFVPRGLDRFLKESGGRFDVGHIHGCHHLLGAIAARRLRHAGIPYVLTTHGTAPRLERRQAAKWLFDQTVGRAVLPEAARVVAVSQAEVTQLRALDVAAGVIRVIPNALDLGQFTPAIERGRFRALKRLGNAPLVLFLGKLTPRKGMGTLVEAFAALGKPDARLAVAGNDLGAGAELDQAIARHGLADRVLRVGLLEGRERLHALADADVLVYPSRDEIFGLVPLEAILSGTPVVVSGDSGCGEVVEKVGGGVVVPTLEPRAFARAIAEVLDAKERWRARAVEAQAKVRALCAPEAVGAQHEQLYRELVS